MWRLMRPAGLKMCWPSKVTNVCVCSGKPLDWLDHAICDTADDRIWSISRGNLIMIESIRGSSLYVCDSAATNYWAGSVKRFEV
jgi:hypothetical protein